MTYWEIIRKYPKFRDLPLLCNEWDIDVWSPGGIHDSPDFRYRNTSYFPVFVIRTVKELLDLRDREKLNLELITQWTFYFHGMRCFEGTRSLLDPLGIRKPVLNGFEMLALLGDERLAVETDDTTRDIQPGEEGGMHGARHPRDAADAAELAETETIRAYPCVDGLAARQGSSVQVLVWNQVADQYASGSREVRVKIDGLGHSGPVRVSEYRIDESHSNAHTLWEGLGCPDWPDQGQIEAMRERESLESAGPSRLVLPSGGAVELVVTLPVQSVSLLILEEAGAGESG